MTEITPVTEIAEAIRDAETRKRAGRGMAVMAERASEFPSRLDMQLAGMAYEPFSRELLEAALTERFASRPPLEGRDVDTFRNREVIIGAGYAAAVYCATRMRLNPAGLKPVVLERAAADYVGGTFAWSPAGVWKLNSGNRPGKFGSPKDSGSSVNYLPGGLLQPAMIPGGDFHTNADIALCIKIALAQFAEVYPGTAVRRLQGSGGGIYGGRLTLANGDNYEFSRVLDARGFGDSRFTGTDAPMMAFPAFMKRMGEPWPLRGIRRAAVWGDGKSAICAAESLLGLTGTVSALDRVERVDLYAPRLPADYFSWRETIRARYLPLGREIGKRLFIYNRQAEPVKALDGIVIGGTSYDFGVAATGFGVPSIDTFTWSNFKDVAMQAEPLEVYQIGVRAKMPFTADERDQGLNNEPDNEVAMFRCGPRVSALAAMLPPL